MVSRRFFIIGLASSIIASLALGPLMLLRAYSRFGGGAVESISYRVIGDRVELPLPRLDGSMSVERAIANRRSIRNYTFEPLSLDELSQVLWAAYGISETRYGFKTTPSAGATYPLEFYAVVYPKGVVLPGGSYLEAGSYRYDPQTHSLAVVKKGDLSRELYTAGLEQEWILNAKTCIIITAIYERTTKRYGERGIRYVLIEVGHAAQNIYLQATALGLATVAIGAFHDGLVREIIGAPLNEHVLYMMPIAKPAKPYTLKLEDLAEHININRRKIDGNRK
jgi:SagB-type dehydrogenase family enzyme